MEQAVLQNNVLGQRMRKAKIKMVPSKKVHLKQNIFSMNYREPVKKDMAVILVYFNIQKSFRLVQNLLYVKRMLDKAKIPYFIGEMSINGEPFLFEASANIFHLRSNDNMFYKEVIINTIEPRIPPEYTKLCIMDADVIFDNNNWYSLLSNKLNMVTICQPFSTAIWLNISYNEIVRVKSSYLKTRSQFSGHPGFVWGFQRPWFHKYKLPISVLGGGDTMFVCTVLEKRLQGNSIMNSWLAKYMSTIPQNISTGFLDLTVYHLYHGSIGKRQYESRHATVLDACNNLGLTHLHEIITFQDDGIMLNWKPRYRDKFNAIMANYLVTRDDDGI